VPVKNRFELRLVVVRLYAENKKGPPSFKEGLCLLQVVSFGLHNYWLVAGETIMICCEIHSVGHAAAPTGIGGLSTEVMGMVSAMEGE
jgi:hypothetical protein